MLSLPGKRILLPSVATLAALGAGAPPAAAATLDDNPCLGPEARELLCPDLAMSRPFKLFQTRTRRGSLLLHAGNSINSVGRGPAELRGRRSGPNTMRARQVVYRTDGSRLMLETGARLGFKTIPGQYRYWKYTYAAEFELWRLDSLGQRRKLERRGPKVYYCLRDLRLTRPALPRSPSRRIYPACSQNARAQRVTLGTSVGWSDVYPSTYHEQWLNVTSLRGCFAYVHIADPRNGIYESNELNNEGETIVRLPWRGGGNRGCPGRSRGEAAPEGGTEAPGY